MPDSWKAAERDDAAGIALLLGLVGIVAAIGATAVLFYLLSLLPWLALLICGAGFVGLCALWKRLFNRPHSSRPKADREQ